MDRVNSLMLHTPMCDACEHRQECDNRHEHDQILQMDICNDFGEGGPHFVPDEELPEWL